MRESMVSRGPDGSGIWFSDRGDIGLAHRRLAILDLGERAAQPMASQDGTVQLVFNGEIYNHPELRRRAEARGAVYRTTSDTETLLQLYELEGDAFVNQLRGMFAFALWDARRHKLLLVRDPFGIKPLYYSGNARGLRFASQTRALLAGGVDDTRSPAGVASFYLWGYVTEPHTWYRNINALPAGSLMRWHPGSEPEVVQFHDPLTPLREPADATSDAPDLRSALVETVNHHLLADVPVGVFLSAGIDSGTLLALAGECAHRRSLRTVTLAFDEYAGTPSDEAPVARRIAEHYQAPHQVITYKRDDFLQERAKLLTAMDQPTVDGTNTYFVSKAAALTGLKVALSGLGGDELFGGYPSFRQVPALVRRLDWVPNRLGRATRRILEPLVSRLTSPKYAGLFEYGGDVGGAYLLRRALFMPWELPDVMGETAATEGLGELDVLSTLEATVAGIDAPYDRVMALELTVYLRNCLLRDADWAGMAHSLEIRTPFVDVQLFAQLAALRRHRGGAPWTKRELASAPPHPLPPEILARPKSGFSVPVREWLLHETGSSGHQPVPERGRRGWARAVSTGFGL